MTIVEELARFLAARLGMPFEGRDAAGGVFFGCLPDRPARAICVYAEELRVAGDLEGSRVQVAIRSDSDGAWPLERAAAVMALLSDRRDLMLRPDGHYIHRVETEQGFEFVGTSETGGAIYAARFRVYFCAQEAAI